MTLQNITAALKSEGAQNCIVFPDGRATRRSGPMKEMLRQLALFILAIIFIASGIFIRA